MTRFTSKCSSRRKLIHILINSDRFTLTDNDFRSQQKYRCCMDATFNKCINIFIYIFHFSVFYSCVCVCGGVVLQRLFLNPWWKQNKNGTGLWQFWSKQIKREMSHTKAATEGHALRWPGCGNKQIQKLQSSDVCDENISSKYIQTVGVSPHTHV